MKKLKICFQWGIKILGLGYPIAIFQYPFKTQLLILFNIPIPFVHFRYPPNISNTLLYFRYPLYIIWIFLIPYWNPEFSFLIFRYPLYISDTLLIYLIPFVHFQYPSNISDTLFCTDIGSTCSYSVNFRYPVQNRICIRLIVIFDTLWYLPKPIIGILYTANMYSKFLVWINM